jgi:type I restriction enzyme S subunit
MKRQRAPLGELCKLAKGTSPISRTPPGAYPLVTTGKEHKTADSFQFDAEAVCIPLISSTGHGHASLKRVHYQSGKFALANLLAAAFVKDTSVLSPKFLSRYLNFTKDRLIVPLMTGAANMSISVDRLATVPVEFPPLAEQERIVRLLDEADELRKLRAQADRRTAQLIPALFHEMFGHPKMRWPVKPLPEVAFFQEGPGVRKWQFRSTGIKLINVGNIVEGQLDLSTTDRHLDENEVANSYSHFLLGAGDLVMATSGATWGKVAFVEERHLPLCLNTSVVRFCPLSAATCTPMFLRGFFETPEFRRQVEQLITGSAQPNFGPSHLKLIRLPVPPIPLQKEFAERVTEIRALEAAQAASCQRLENLFQSMLHKAFNGEL